MHSPPNKRAGGDPHEVADNVQDTLDALELDAGGDPSEGGREASVPGERASGTDLPVGSRQESIDVFFAPERVEERASEGPTHGSRAMEGIALEMSMERVALQEASRGIIRDELLLTIARECRMPLENLDMVESYVSDLELEGRLHRVGDMVVLAFEGDEDLFSSDLEDDEVMEIFRRRHRGDVR